jgi:hypothetical protein
MNTDWRNDAEVQQAARSLFVGVIPERREELEGFWEKYDLRFNVLEEITEDGSFILDAGQYRDIRFNHRAMQAFWLAGFIAWEGYRAIHSYLTKGTKDFQRYNEMIDVFYCILRDDDSAHVPMPKGIPGPGNYAELIELRAAAELSTFAVGWALLHEVRHIRHQREGTSAALEAPPDAKRAEELSCDEFATRFMLERVREFAAEHEKDPELARHKRELGIYFAMFALTLIGTGNWGDSATHPATQTRINALINQIQGTGTRMFDAIAHVAFVALRSRWPEAQGPFKLEH